MSKLCFSSQHFLPPQPDVYPGNCWAFKGSQGYLVIRLSLRILPTSFCVEHIPKALSPTGNITSAPQNFTVYVRNEQVYFQSMSSICEKSLMSLICFVVFLSVHRVWMMSTRRKGSCWDTTHTRRTGSHCKHFLSW